MRSRPARRGFRRAATVGFMAACVWASAASAQSATTVTRTDFLAAPESYRGKLIRVTRIFCVGKQEGGVACAVELNRRILRIDAAALGPETTAETRRRLGENCKGADDLRRRACLFNATFAASVVRISRDARGARVTTAGAARVDLSPGLRR
jgi:hypothetical protein